MEWTRFKQLISHSWIPVLGQRCFFIQWQISTIFYKTTSPGCEVFERICFLWIRNKGVSVRCSKRGDAAGESMLEDIWLHWKVLVEWTRNLAKHAELVEWFSLVYSWGKRKKAHLKSLSLDVSTFSECAECA